MGGKPWKTGENVAQTQEIVAETPVDLNTSDEENLDELDKEVKQLEMNDVLIFKKSAIESKIFASVIKKIVSTVDTANSQDDFRQKLEEKCYKVVMFDKEISVLSPEDTASLIKKSSEMNGCTTNTILFYDASSNVDESLSSLFDETVPNMINKNQLEVLISKYIKE